MCVGRVCRRLGSWITIIEQATNILKKGIGVYPHETEKKIHDQASMPLIYKDFMRG